MLAQRIPLASAKTSFIEAVFLGFCTFFILTIFQPFGTYTYQHQHKVLLLLVYGAISFTVHLSLRLGVSKSWSRAWLLRQEVLLLLLSVSLSSLLSFVYHQLVIYNSGIRFQYFPAFLLMALAISFFPLTAILWQKLNLHRHTAKQPSIVPGPEQELLLCGSNKNEVYHFREDAVLYLMSEGNYVKVTFLLEEKPKTVMLRATLKQLQDQLPSSFVQTHRSYLVQLRNYNKLQTQAGKAVLVSHQHAEEVPVSASYLVDIRKKLQDYTRFSSQNSATRP